MAALDRPSAMHRPAGQLGAAAAGGGGYHGPPRTSGSELPLQRHSARQAGRWSLWRLEASTALCHRIRQGHVVRQNTKPLACTEPSGGLSVASLAGKQAGGQ